MVNGHGSDPCVLTDLRVQVPSWVLGCEDMAVCKGELKSELFHGIFNGRYANWIKQADCKSAAFGPCKFKSYSADYTLQSLNWRRSCLEDFRPVIPACGFESRLQRCKGMCAKRAGSLSRKQVIRKGLGVRIPSSPLLSRSGRIGKCTCLLSRGRLVRHPGSGPGSGAL